MDSQGRDGAGAAGGEWRRAVAGPAGQLHADLLIQVTHYQAAGGGGVSRGEAGQQMGIVVGQFDRYGRGLTQVCGHLHQEVRHHVTRHQVNHVHVDFV